MALSLKTLTMSNSDEAFKKAADSIQRRGESVQLDIHIYLVGVAARWATTGDIRPAVSMTNYLIGKLPKGVRSNAVKAWVETHFGFVWGNEKDGFVAGPSPKAHKDLDIKTLANVRWWTFKPEAPYKGLDFTASVLTLIKKADERIAAPNEADTIDTDILRAVKFAAAGKALDAAAIIDAIRALEPADLMQVLTALQPVEMQVAA